MDIRDQIATSTLSAEVKDFVASPAAAPIFEAPNPDVFMTAAAEYAVNAGASTDTKEATSTIMTTDLREGFPAMRPIIIGIIDGQDLSAEKKMKMIVALDNAFATCQNMEQLQAILPGLLDASLS